MQDLYIQRLTAVETRLEAIEEVQKGLAVDMRIVRDHMVATSGARKAFKTVLSFAIGILVLIGAVWKLAKGIPPDGLS